MNTWVNMASYQATWIVAVAGAGSGRGWAGPAMLAAFATWQLATSRWRRADGALVLAISAIGFGIDTAFCRLGLMQFAAADPAWGVAPPWMVALWSSFALALNHSLAFLQRHVVVAALLGAIGAPAAYWAAGSGWHAVSFGSRPWLTIALVAAIWAVAMPAFSRLALRWRRFDDCRLAATTPAAR